MARPPIVLSESGRRYVATRPLTAQEILNQAELIIRERFRKRPEITGWEAAASYLAFILAGNLREVFGVLLLNNRNQLLKFEEVSLGNINSAPVYPGEIAKAALRVNAAAVILAHNHTAGDPTPSSADRMLTVSTHRLLAELDVRVEDHIIVGGRGAFSFRAHGLEPWGSEIPNKVRVNQSTKRRAKKRPTLRRRTVKRERVLWKN